MWKTSSPTEVKKSRPTTCRIFTQSTKQAKTLQSNTHCYKVTHTRPTSLGHTYLVFSRQATRHNVLVPLDLDTLHTLLTREMKRSPYYNASQIKLL